MFETYDLSTFGMKLKDIRVNLGYSQAEVSKKTNINIDTIRKIENGYSLPRYDTLIHLSKLYKVDLHKKLSIFKSSEILLNFYNKIDYLISRSDSKELVKQYRLFLDELNHSKDLELVSNSTLEQLSLFVKATSSRYSHSKENLVYSYETLCYALRIENPEFDVENFESFKYSYFEHRLLLTLGNVLGDLKNYVLSNRIANYLLKINPIGPYCSKNDESLVIKCHCLLSYNAFRTSDDESAMNFATNGINICLENHNMESLPFLMFRKGVSQYMMNDPQHLKTLKNCINLLDIIDDKARIEDYELILKKNYAIDLS